MDKETKHLTYREWEKACREWREHIPDIKFTEIVDNLLSLVFGEVIIDIFKLDDRLKSLYPEDWDNGSMAEIITKHYGEEANKLIRSLI